MKIEQRCRAAFEIDGIGCLGPHLNGDDDNQCIGHIGMSKEFPSLAEGLQGLIDVLQHLLDKETKNV